jgi:hypothetical protein
MPNTHSNRNPTLLRETNFKIPVALIKSVNPTFKGETFETKFPNRGNRIL